MFKKIILAKVLLRLCQHQAAHTSDMQKTINRLIDEIAGGKSAKNAVPSSNIAQPRQICSVPTVSQLPEQFLTAEEKAAKNESNENK